MPSTFLRRPKLPWRRRRRSLGGASHVTFPEAILGIRVQLALGANPSDDPRTDWAWNTDITSYVRYSDRISITRGRSDEQSRTPPSRCGLTLTNNDSRFTPHNPTGDYFGQLGLNTPIRVQVNPGTGWVTRFTGFISEFAHGRDTSGSDRYVRITASGTLRRIGQGSAPIKSLTKSVVQYQAEGFDDLITSYWPLEDDVGAVQAAYGLATGTPMTVLGTVDFDAVTAPAGSAAAPNLSAGGLRGVCNNVAATGEWSVTFYVNCTGTCRPISWTTTGTLSWYVDITASTVTVGNSGGGSAAIAVAYADGEWHVISVFCADDAGAAAFTIIGDSSDFGGSTTAASTSGRVDVVTVNPAIVDADLVSVNHVIVGGTTSSSITPTLMNGSPGGTAASNFASIGSFNGVAVDYTSAFVFVTEAMGTYPIGPLLDTFQECADADEGLLIDRLTGELGFDSHLDRENLNVALVLDWAQHEIVPRVDPVDDDQRIRNDWGVTSATSFGQVVDEDGPLGVSAKGRYDDTATLNLYTADQPRQHAGWKVNLGTVGESRFPALTINLAHDPNLIPAWLACDVGSRVTVTNPPIDVASETVDQIIEGYTEDIDQFIWTATLNCAPYLPYGIFTLADTAADPGEWVGRMDGDDALIRVAIDDNDLSIEFDPNRCRWTTVADDFDPDLGVRFGGETADISTIATTAATFVAAGAMSSADNAAVTPAMYAGATANDWILVLARIRSTSAGTLTTPNSYTRLPIKNLTSTATMQLYAKVHSGSESDPTVTPSGGAAGDTVSAVTFGLRSMPITLADLTDAIVDSWGQSNASAQDIAYPGLYPYLQEGCVILALGGKDDDWTSVATLSGFTEAVDASTTTGNDQGLVVDYVIQTTPAVVNEGSFTVTGGASAVSHGALIALCGGYQTMTVSARSTNGVVKSHAAGTQIGVDHARVLSV